MTPGGTNQLFSRQIVIVIVTTCNMEGKKSPAWAHLPRSTMLNAKQSGKTSAAASRQQQPGSTAAAAAGRPRLSTSQRQQRQQQQQQQQQQQEAWQQQHHQQQQQSLQQQQQHQQQQQQEAWQQQQPLWGYLTGGDGDQWTWDDDYNPAALAKAAAAAQQLPPTPRQQFLAARAAAAAQQRPTVITRLPEQFTSQALSNGLLLVDKPARWSAADVVRQLSAALGTKRLCHAGPLDSHATGLLILLLGSAARLTPKFEPLERTYSGTLQLGVATATHDATGQVTAVSPWQHVTDADLEAAAAQLQGEIQQLPAIWSSTKYKNRPLWWYAQRGEEVPRQPKAVHITSFSLWREPGQAAAAGGGSSSSSSDDVAGLQGGAVALQPAAAGRGRGRRSRSSSSSQSPGTAAAGDGDGCDDSATAEASAGAGSSDSASSGSNGSALSEVVHFRVTASKGASVRVLAHDLGQLLGCGAHVTSLRRQAVGGFSVDSAWSLEVLLPLAKKYAKGVRTASSARATL